MYVYIYACAYGEEGDSAVRRERASSRLTGPAEVNWKWGGGEGKHWPVQGIRSLRGFGALTSHSFIANTPPALPT